MKRGHLIFIAIFMLALFVRSAGLFRGLEAGNSFHPDAPKQVVATLNYLKGHYLWYTGSLAYDGYPYGLNHIDEWIIRAVWPAGSAILRALQPSIEIPTLPTQEAVFYLCRTLRVAYSLLAWAIFAWILKRCSVPRGQRWVWLLLAALAPIASGVTHSVTGDVGTDLFAIAALAFLVHARSAAPRAILFAGCGIAVGCAFACKYHGVLAGLTPALFLLLAPLTWRQRFRLGVAVIIGALIGFAALTPHVFIAPEKTLKLIGQNFIYIQNYGVSESFAKLPRAQRLFVSLTNNVPVVFHAIGIATIGLATIALLLSANRIRRARTSGSAFDFGLIAMPFAVLALALSGKPELQPFHFSFLILPLLLGSALAWQSGNSRALRILLPVVLAFNIGEYALKQKYDLYFWVREDTLHVAQRMSANLLESQSGARSRRIARLAVEGDNRAVFRNKPIELRFADLAGWEQHPDDILPATPWSGSADWIFADLPAFPRESRLLVLPVNQRIRRVAVTPFEQELVLTLYAGLREAEVHVTVGHTTEVIALAPFETRRITNPSARATSFSQKATARSRYDLSLLARGADVLLRVGEEPDTVPDPDRAARKLEHARFLDGTLQPGQSVLAKDICLLPGVYFFEMNAPESVAPMALEIRESQLPHPDRNRHLPLLWTQGVCRVQWTESEPLFFAAFSLSSSGDLPEGAQWRIKPVATVASQATETATAPEWKPAFSFGDNAWIVVNLELPPRIARGGEFSIRTKIETTVEARENLRDYSLFVHLLNGNGKQVFARDIPLLHIPSARAPLELEQRLGPLDLEPGRYTVAMGLYAPRPNIRIKPDKPATPLDGNRVLAGTLDIE